MHISNNFCEELIIYFAPNGSFLFCRFWDPMSTPDE